MTRNLVSLENIFGSRSCAKVIEETVQLLLTFNRMKKISMKRKRQMSAFSITFLSVKEEKNVFFQLIF